MCRVILWLIVGVVANLGIADEFSELKSANWHQWRGPEADGVSSSAAPPVTWSESQNVKWKVAVPGKGSSTPIIWQDRVYLTTAVKTDRLKEGATPPAESSNSQGGGGRGGRGRGGFGGGAPPVNYYQFLVVALDRQTGNEVWRTQVAEEVPHEAGHNTNSFASSSPVTDGERIYACFGSRGLFCLDMNGDVLWQKDLGEMRTILGFGEGSSPALHQGTLVVPWDHEGDSFIVAFDAKSGQELWKVPRDEGTTWATPLITEHQGVTQVVTNGKNRVRSYNLSNGELLWECGGQASNPIPSPVRHGDYVICMTGFRGYAIFAIPLDARGDITGSDKILWQGGDAAPYVPSPVLYQDQLYFTKGNDGILVSRDVETGKVVIGESRLPDINSVYASPVAAADKIYLTARDGTTLVLKHGTELEILATNKLGEGVDASLALVGNQIFIRGEQHLYCIAAETP